LPRTPLAIEARGNRKAKHGKRLFAGGDPRSAEEVGISLKKEKIIPPRALVLKSRK
jgi:hypothetical protein